MARVKLSEFRAKSILLDNYAGTGLYLEALESDLKNLDIKTKYVVKVDQGIKKRGKQGLLALNIVADEAKDAVQELADKGFTRFLAEPMLAHEPEEEHYLSIELTRNGYAINYSAQGGIDIEDHPETIHTYLYPEDIDSIDEETPFPIDWLTGLIERMKQNYLSFVEINPLVVSGSSVTPLDAAVLVDDAGDYFAEQWSEDDIVETAPKFDEEKTVAELDANTPAALKLKVLNPDGAIWTLFSGGGASITIADEIQAAGLGKELGSYGEYSGGPTTEETYLYTKEILSLMLKSKASKKVLVVAGGVANFTDVASTFKGLIQALQERVEEAKSAGVKVYVRRGGPNEKAGLAKMEEFLKANQLFGSIAGSDALLTDAITNALAALGDKQ